jgi:ribulose-5-phosphate 4-epimerase/fuculose-1-phosphate aldolase
MAVTVGEDVVQALKQRIVDGLAVLTGEGVLDGAGHLSARIPGTETFLINPRFPGILADPDDMCAVDFSAKRIAGAGPIPSESQIHAAVYRHRPDVSSVVHCHARSAILVSNLESGLIPFNREARSFADGVPVFPESHGIDSHALAERMVRSLGDHMAVFLQGHGVVVASPTIEGTCLLAISLENACREQLLLLSFTTPKPLKDQGRGGPSRERLENPYRAWPFLLYKHGVKSKAEIKAGLRPLPEGQHY